MSSSDALWLNVWGTIAAIGFIIVIIGVIIEGVEHFKKFPRKENARKLQIEKIGWFLVVAGLAMEFLGDHAAKRISDRENARVNKQAADARVAAGVAGREAGQANERAANTESNNLVLKKELLEVERSAIGIERKVEQASTNVAKIDPLNQPISDIFANVVISLPGGQFSEPPPNWWGNSEAAELEMRVATMDGTNMLVGICYLTAYSFARLTAGVEHSYAVTFHSDVKNNFAPFFGNLAKVADMVNNVSNVMIYAKFIPHDTEITDYGNATIYINGGVITKSFHIKKQKALGKKEGGLGTGFDDDGFTIIATP